MSKAKFDAAKELIREGQYTQARILLESIDHPQAKEWLKKLHDLEVNALKTVGVAPGSVKVSLEKPKSSKLRGCLYVVGAVVVLSAIGSALPRTPNAVVPVVTDLPTSTISPTASQTQSPVRATDDIVAIEKTSDSISPAMMNALKDLPDLAGVRRVSGMLLDEGWSFSVDVDVALADDTEFTMERVRGALDQVGSCVLLYVTTYSNNEISKNWMWEDNVWHVADLRASDVVVVTVIVPPELSQ